MLKSEFTQSQLVLASADRLEVQVLVDNVTDQLSTNLSSVRSELAGLLTAGMTEWSGEALCCAHHGLSLVITAYSGRSSHKLLFDAGPEGYAIERNGDRLGIDFGAVEGIVLSHGHYDHGGGLLKALDLICKQNPDRQVPLYLHPDIFWQRAFKLPSGKILPLKAIPGIQELSRHGGAVNCTSQPQLLLNDLFYISGEIPRVTAYEQGLPNHLRKTQQSDDWEPDPLIMDERFLTVNVRDKGLIVFTACSHAGVINVLKHAQSTFPDTPIYAVMGGFHLSGAGPEKIISQTVKDLSNFGLQLIVPGHCTGWRAVTALVNQFGEEGVSPSAVGKHYTF